MKIVVDGPIGAGKSTQVDNLSKLTGLTVIKEPVHEWPLELFYKDPSRWGLMMQVAVLNSYIKIRDYDGILERCPGSTRAVFWKNLVDTNVVTVEEDKVFSALYETHSWEPELTIFIDKKPETCFKHIQKRSQDGDTGITLEYLQSLHALYHKYVSEHKNIHVVNGEQSIKNVTRDIVKIINPYIHKECPFDAQE